MNLTLTIGPLTLDEVNRLVPLLAANGVTTHGVTAAPATPQEPLKVSVAPPQKAAPAMPPMGNGAKPAEVASPAPAAPPAPPPASPAPPSNAKLEQVLKLMDAYSRAGHQVAGARKVLGLLGLSRAQDADEAQLDWLAQAFANTGWAP